LEWAFRLNFRNFAREGPLPVNATGAIGAILSELSFPWQMCRGIAVISRAAGLVGHIAEEMRNPLAREIWERSEHEVFENVPREQKGVCGDPYRNDIAGCAAARSGYRWDIAPASHSRRERPPARRVRREIYRERRAQQRRGLTRTGRDSPR
jgi:hypothetical protein